MYRLYVLCTGIAYFVRPHWSRFIVLCFFNSRSKLLFNCSLVEHCSAPLHNSRFNCSHEHIPVRPISSFISSQRFWEITDLIFCQLFNHLKKRAHSRCVKPHPSKSSTVATSATCVFITWFSANIFAGRLARFNRWTSPTSTSKLGGVDIKEPRCSQRGSTGLLRTIPHTLLGMTKESCCFGPMFKRFY